MALFSSSPSPVPFVRSHKHSSILKPSISETLIPRTIIPKITETSISVSFNLFEPSVQRFHCCTSSSSSFECDKSPSTRIVIKGLPNSTSERSLNRTFSQFGEVGQVKIITDYKTRQSLGFAYVWFTSEASAQLAVKEMNGKFFDGRFVFVTIAKPGSSDNRVRATPYKF